MATASNPSPFGLRPYQREAVDAVRSALAQHPSTLLVMPTGTGKTATFSALADEWRSAGGGPVLALAHRAEIVEQNARALERAGLAAAVEMGDDRASQAGHLFGSVDAVSASVQSMARRLRQYRPDAFGLVVMDEAHHAVPGSQYESVRKHFEGAKLLGVTATPDRLDKRGLGAMFASVAYTYEIRDAIGAGYLVPLKQQLVHVDGLDFSRIRTVAGDLNEGDLDAVMREDGALHGIAEPAVRLAGDRPALVFSVSVEHAHALAAVLNMYAGEGMARALDGGTDKEIRKRTLAEFREGAFRFLVNCALFTEGTDLPWASCAVMARPTQSRALYAQMVGRVLRPYQGKPDALVLDFAGNAGKHSLVLAAQILGADIDPLMAQRAAKRATQTGEDIETAVDALLAEDRLADLKRRAVQVRARVRVQDIDPFAVFELPRHDGRTTEPATVEQAARLLQAGLKEADVQRMDRMQAADLLAAISRNRRDGMATFKQQRFLMSRGLRWKGVTFKEAGKVIDAIHGNNWRVPDAILDAYGLTP